VFAAISGSNRAMRIDRNQPEIRSAFEREKMIHRRAQHCAIYAAS
jgi:hypothetical protein